MKKLIIILLQIAFVGRVNAMQQGLPSDGSKPVKTSFASELERAMDARRKRLQQDLSSNKDVNPSSGQEARRPLLPAQPLSGTVKLVPVKPVTVKPSYVTVKPVPAKPVPDKSVTEKPVLGVGHEKPVYSPVKPVPVKPVPERPVFTPQVQEPFQEPAPEVDGLKLQLDQILDFVGDSFKKSPMNSGGFRRIDAVDLAKNIEIKAKDIGFDLRFVPDKTYGLFDRNYVINGVNRVSGYNIFKLNIANNSYSVGFGANITSGDGCIKSGEDLRLFFNKKLETYFFKNGSSINIVDERKFATKDQNSYKVIQYPGLYQSVNGHCGFYAINNIAVAYNGINDLSDILDRTRFNLLLGDLVELRLGNTGALSNLEISNIINTNPNFEVIRKSNMMISLEKINNQNVFDVRKFMTFANGGTPQDRITDFRKNGTTQYLIISTGDKNSNHDINGLNLNWDNRNNRKYCLDNHWLAIKIEWQNSKMPGKSPVIISVFDSGPTDSRYASLIHWYYYMFVHKPLNSLLGETNVTDDYE